MTAHDVVIPLNRRARVRELARRVGVADGFTHYQDTGVYVATPQMPRTSADAVLRAVGVRAALLPAARLVHRASLRFCYDLGYATGQRHAAQQTARAIVFSPLPRPSRDQKGTLRW